MLRRTRAPVLVSIWRQQSGERNDVLHHAPDGCRLAADGFAARFARSTTAGDLTS
jgi:hypothetical protein